MYICIKYNICLYVVAVDIECNLQLKRYSVNPFPKGLRETWIIGDLIPPNPFHL